MSEVRKYRKKPVEVEAVQYREGMTPVEVERLVEWVTEGGGTASWVHSIPGDPGCPNRAGHDSWRYCPSCDFADPEYEHVRIRTLEGVMGANVGDYIIKGVAGEFYPCRADIFEQTYEAASEQ